MPDAGIGAVTYLLEIVTGLVGSSRRWRTIPWMVILFGLMIVPLGIVSITFIIIQPIIIGTWCTLCLIAASAMVIQIPYSLDELIATGQFLTRRGREKSFLRAFIFGTPTRAAGAIATTSSSPCPSCCAKWAPASVCLGRSRSASSSPSR